MAEAAIVDENPEVTGASDKTVTGDVGSAATILDGDKGDVKEASSSKWPDNWREEMAGGDEKVLKQLNRFNSPDKVTAAWLAANQKISSGEYKKSLTEDATEEEKATWLKENGIPEKAEDYDTDLGNGIIFGEEDKPIIDDFLKSAHAANMPNDMVKNALTWYHENQEKQLSAQQDADAEFRKTAEDELRNEWGAEYRQNTNLISSFLDTAPEGVKDNFLGARLADGTLLGDSPNVLRFLADAARQINPLASIIPGGGGDVESIETEIASIETRMREDRNGYFKDERMQKRYGELITAREKLKG